MQRFIPHQMALLVIDILEIIHIQQNQSAASGACVTRNIIGNLLLKSASVQYFC